MSSLSRILPLFCGLALIVFFLTIGWHELHLLEIESAQLRASLQKHDKALDSLALQLTTKTSTTTSQPKSKLESTVLSLTKTEEIKITETIASTSTALSAPPTTDDMEHPQTSMFGLDILCRSVPRQQNAHLNIVPQTVASAFHELSRVAGFDVDFHLALLRYSPSDVAELTATVENATTVGDSKSWFSKGAFKFKPFALDSSAGVGVRQQMINDVRALFEWWQPKCRREYFVLLEDDFAWCPRSGLHLLHILRQRFEWQQPFSKNNFEFRTWRFSYGLNGILLRCSDLPSYVEVLARPKPSKNVDWLLASEWAGESLENRHASVSTYRYNLLEHLGFGKSTVGSRANPSAPRCYDALVSAWTLKNELFDYANCAGKSDFSPCEQDRRSLVPLLPLDRVRPRWMDRIASTSSARRPSAGGGSNHDHQDRANKLFVATGKLGQSCDSVCETATPPLPLFGNASCDIDSFPIISRCREMRRRFACRVCHEQGSLEQPSFLPHTGECLANMLVGQFSCQASHPKTQRLCPCVARDNGVDYRRERQTDDNAKETTTKAMMMATLNNNAQHKLPTRTIEKPDAELQLQVNATSNNDAPKSQNRIDTQYHQREIQNSIALEYKPFGIRFPIFLDDDSRKWWLSTQSLGPPLYERQVECRKQKEHPLCALDNYIVFWTDRYTSGSVEVLRNVALREFPCGWASAAFHDQMSDSLQKQSSSLLDVGKNKAIVNPVLVIAPQSEFIQHMIDGALPKLAHFFLAREQQRLDAAPATLFVHRRKTGAFQMVYDLWELFASNQNASNRNASIDNVHSPSLAQSNSDATHGDFDSVFTMTGYNYFFPRLVSACIAPPFHPTLWTKMQTLVHERLDAQTKAVSSPELHRRSNRKSLIYLKRLRKTGKNLRLIVNDNAVEALLQSYAADNNLDFVVFSHPDYPTLAAVFELFSSAEIVVGPHGGAFANLLFCKPGAKVVEIRPRVASTSVRTTSENFWIHSSMWQHSYRLLWADSKPPHSSTLGMLVNLDNLRKLLDAPLLDEKNTVLYEQ